MTDQAQQDIDSGAGKVVTPGEPAKHIDVEDGQSVGHTAEPEHQEGSSGNEPEPRASGAPPTAADMPAPTPPPKTSREEIYAKAKTGRDTEMDEDMAAMTEAGRAEHIQRLQAEAGGDVPDPFAQSEEPPAAPNQPPAQGKEPPAQPPQGIDSKDQTTTIVVYGMREEVPTADVEAAGGLAAYQKQRAADVRLERVATYEASLRNWEDQLSKRAADQQQTPAQSGTGISEPSDTDVPGDSVDVGALSEVVTDAFYSGDRDEAASKLKDALTAIQTDAIRAARAAVPAQSQPSAPGADDAQAKAMREANAVFSSEFRDLDTPVLRQAALNMVETVQRDPVMIGRPLSEITREACTRVRQDVFGTTEAPDWASTPPAQSPAGQQPLHQQPTVPPQQDLAGRYQMKRRTVVTPINEAQGRSPAPPSQQQQFPSNKEVVANMRKARGQPV